MCQGTHTGTPGRCAGSLARLKAVLLAAQPCELLTACTWAGCTSLASCAESAGAGNTAPLLAQAGACTTEDSTAPRSGSALGIHSVLPAKFAAVNKSQRMSHSSQPTVCVLWAQGC